MDAPVLRAYRSHRSPPVGSWYEWECCGRMEIAGVQHRKAIFGCRPAASGAIPAGDDTHEHQPPDREPASTGSETGEGRHVDRQRQLHCLIMDCLWCHDPVYALSVRVPQEQRLVSHEPSFGHLHGPRLSGHGECPPHTGMLPCSTTVDSRSNPGTGRRVRGTDLERDVCRGDLRSTAKPSVVPARRRARSCTKGRHRSASL